MTRQRWNKKTGLWESPEEEQKEPIHVILNDSMEPIESMASPTGEVFDSKSAYKRHLKEEGYEITGGENLTGRGADSVRHESDRADIKHDVAEANRKLKWGMAPMTEMEKELSIREERRYNQWKKRNGKR